MTDQEPTQEELQKFWEWTGIYTRGHVIPALTLDGLFEYAVPKAVNRIAREFHMTEDDAEHHLLHTWHNRRRQCLSWKTALLRAIQEAVK